MYALKPEIVERIRKVKSVVSQIEKWYAEKPSPQRWKYWALTRFLVLQGVRISEALSLTWEDVDLEEKTASIILLKKREKVKRIIPLHPKVIEALKEYKGQRKGKIWRMTRIAVYLFYKKFGLHPHIFRHYFGTALLKSGVDLETARRALGHSTYSVLQIYLHVDLEDIRRKIEQLKIPF